MCGIENVGESTSDFESKEESKEWLGDKGTGITLVQPLYPECGGWRVESGRADNDLESASGPRV